MYKVVVVEDEKRVRQGIVMGTDWSGINCIVMGEASNGEEGVEIIRKCKPDIVITDIRMPRMMGIEMIEKVHEEGLEPCVIFLSAYDDFAYAQQAVKLGAADYLLKPFSDGELENAVLKIAEKNRREEEKREQPNGELKLDRGDKSKYIMDAIAYVEQNYANPSISVRDVADSLGISEGHLSFLFRKETDSTLMAYVTKCRMRAAMNLLKSYRHKVYEVAQQVGYRDITYFSKTFKKYVGVSPSEYQNRYSPE
ncbi:MAG: response regulator [Lachnospiraceae bacterium]|nr:response regulator [Lachnospiraceae bacterium]